MALNCGNYLGLVIRVLIDLGKMEYGVKMGGGKKVNGILLKFDSGSVGLTGYRGGLGLRVGVDWVLVFWALVYIGSGCVLRI